MSESIHSAGLGTIIIDTIAERLAELTGRDVRMKLTVAPKPTEPESRQVRRARERENRKDPRRWRENRT